jgi:hypothetical protein
MIYTVVLNSYLRLPGTSVNNATYNFDWSNAMPEGNYRLTWSWVSSNVSATSADIILISAELGQSHTFLADPVSVKAQSSLILGTAVANEIGGLSFYYGDRNSNGPMELGLPKNNQFSVKLTNTAAVPVFWTDSVGRLLDSYILTLSFETI